MPSATSDAQTVRIPAWKKLGLKLKSAQDTTTTQSPKDVDTPKRKRVEESEEVLSSKKVKKSKPPADNPITPNLVRKKSVTFTPETKVEDGDSIKQLFNSWVTEQKSQDPSFELNNSNPAFSTPEPSRVEEIDPDLPEKERRIKRVKNPKVEKVNQDPKSAKKTKLKSKSKIDKQTKPTSPFLTYLRTYHEDKPNWKFNKNHQNHIIKHIFELNVIPSDHAHFIFAYVKGLQGGARTRLRDAAIAVKDKDIEEGVNGFPETMNDRDRKQREYDEACNEYVATLTALNAPPEMGYEEGVLLGLSDYAMKERMAKRARAEKILAELGANPEGEGSKDEPVGADSQKSLGTNGGSVQRVARKRKQRTMVEDVDSSSSDSSDSDSSTEAPAQPRQARPLHYNSDDTSSSSSSSSSSGSEGENDSEEDEDSEEDSEESDSE